MHTPECQEQLNKIEVAITAWKEQWPNYCQKCDGQGASYWTENQSPLGSGLNWPIEMSEPCECTYEGICPRCGEQGIDPETAEGPCSECGWNFGDCMPAHDGDCGCWEPEWQAEQIETAQRWEATQ